MDEKKAPMGINEKLSLMQTQLKAPKGQYNQFGKYNYRSCEDILEALKPLLKLYAVNLTLCDEIVLVGDRIYVKATATLTDYTGLGKISVTAFAREEESKKGMDGSQVTGAASSYARKYALNGLFCIDDTKDSDATNTHGKDAPKQEAPKQEAPKQEPTCIKCGKAIGAYTGKNGKYVTVDQHCNLSIKKFGGTFCIDCINDMKT